MKITKALITCAGFGTRFLPITKSVQKEMLPILNRPMIDYVVSDCLDAGIEEIFFIVNENENQLVEHFYSESKILKQHMVKLGKEDRYEKSKLNIPSHVKFRFITQTVDDKYGTAIPVYLAKEYLENEEAFLVFMGDDFIYSKDTVEAKEMIKLFNSSKAEGLVTCITKPEAELYRYGVAEIKNDSDHTYLTNLIEKPETGTAPSNLINISKYIFTPKIFKLIENQKPNLSNGEYYITDTATQLAQNSPVVIYTPKGTYLDGGNVLNWLKANLIVAKDDPNLYPELQKFISEEF
jgi:UTP--glucose-1-phosphate uridylyltransferase